MECEDPEKYVGGAMEFLESAKNVSSNNEVSTSAHDRVRRVRRVQDDRTSVTGTKPTSLSFGTQTTGGMCQCELWPKECFTTFLNRMESLIQIINNQL